jgi:predicted nucleic acid-binding protein
LIAVDTSTLQRLLAGILGSDTALARAAFDRGELFVPPVVICEALSDPEMSAENERRLLLTPVMPLLPGFWQRAGLLRRSVHAVGLKAKLPDTLVAQSCIDHDIPLITYDRDFRNFVRAGLMLA